MAADSPNHFFKFIKPNSKFNISIPRSFWTNLKETRCKKSILKRGLHEWAVEISDEGVFCDGWKEFVTDNGVQEFEFIVFKHQGNMVFDFLVFDQSMCEKDYPSMLFEVEVEVEVDVEYPLIESYLTHKYERSKVVGMRKKNDHSSKNEDKLKVDDDRCFRAKIKPDCIKHHRLCVPTKFVRSTGLLNGKRRIQVVLRDEAQRTWHATIDTQFHLGRLYKFIKNNDVKVEDECMFELIKYGKVPVFNVVIQRSKVVRKRKRNDHLSKNEDRKRKRSDQLSKNEDGLKVDDNRCFTAKITQNCIKNYILCVPAKFVRSNGLLNGKKRIQVVLMDEARRIWHATIGTQFHLGRLYKFIKNNDLKVEDECTFQLIKHGKVPVFSVMIQRSKVVGNRKRNYHSSKNDDNRCFTAKIRPDCIKHYRLCVPRKFVRSNGLLNRERRIKVVLMDESRRTWHATIDISQFHLTSLREFIRNNDLKVEDECTFEIIKHGKVPVFNVLLRKKKSIVNDMVVKKKRKTNLRMKKETSMKNDHRSIISTIKPSSLTMSDLVINTPVVL